VKKSTVIQIAGAIVIAGAGLYIFLRDVSVARLWNDLRHTPLWAIGGGVALTFLTLWLRSVRWNLILPKSSTASRKGLFGLVMISFMVNNLLPARIGEAARMVLLWKRNRFTVAESVGSVLLERVLDSVVFLSFFFIPALVLARLRAMVPYAVPLACGAGAVLAALLLYAFFPVRTRAVSRTLLKLLPQRLRDKAQKIGKELVSNLDWIFSPAKCLAVVLLSFVIIACHPGILLLLVRENAFGFLSGMFCAACAAIGAAIPLSPGYVGTLHAVLKQGLVQCGIETNRAIAVATLYHAIGYTTVTVAGLYYYFQMKISFKEIGKAKEELGKEKS
jgi:glycosyltransferase 2 family protein